MGVAYAQLGKTPEAIRALEQAVRIDSGRPDRLRALAQAYDRAGRDPATVDRLYQRALSLQPALAWLRADYADYLQSQGRRDEAIKAYRAALAEQPSLAAGWFNLGAVLAESGQLRQSTDAFQRAVDLDPSMGEALSRLFEVHAQESSVIAVRQLPSQLESLAVRDRGPRAIQLSASTSGAPGLRFFNVPPRSLVQIQKPDGTLIRALAPVDAWAVEWSLTTDGGLRARGCIARRSPAAIRPAVRSRRSCSISVSFAVRVVDCRHPTQRRLPARRTAGRRRLTLRTQTDAVDSGAPRLLSPESFEKGTTSGRCKPPEVVHFQWSWVRSVPSGSFSVPVCVRSVRGCLRPALSRVSPANHQHAQRATSCLLDQGL